MSSEFTRLSTVIRMLGGGEEGVGEDVTYDALDHIALQDAGPTLPLAGEWTIGSFSEHLDGIDLFPGRARARAVERLPPLGVRVARRSTWRCARRAARSPTCWAASRGR